MPRGKSSKPRQAEKMLLAMLDGHEVSLPELETTLGSHIALYRLSVYLWNLKKIGATIKRNTVNRKLVSIQLINTEEMTTYARSRGLVAPLPVVLTPDDLMVAAG
jgi:hypothetical protein